jgi:O-antigen/teichoic acid export membrane protein
MLGRAWRDPVYGNGVALVLNSGIASALGFLYWLVVARRYDSASIGWGAAVVSAATLAALLGKAGFDAALIRFGPSASERHLTRLLWLASGAAVGLTAVVASAMLVLARLGVAGLAPELGRGEALAFLALAGGTALAWVFDAFFIAEQTALYTLYRNVAFNVLKLVAPFAVAASLAALAVPLTWGVGLAASVLVAIPFVPLALRRRRRLAGENPAAAAAPPSPAELVAYSAKNYALNVSEFLPSLLFPLLVLAALGPVANARFYLAWTVATVGFLASKAVAQSSFAALVREGSPRLALAKGALLCAVLLVPFAAGLLVAAPLLLALFGQGGHGDAVTMLRLLAISIPPLCATNLYVAYLKARAPGWELTLLPAATLVAVALASPALDAGGMAALGALWLAVQSVAAAYALVRLAIVLRRDSHDTRTVPAPLRRRAHEG